MASNRGEDAPENVYGPKIQDLIDQLARAINAETRAAGVRIDIRYMNFMGLGQMELKIGVSPDANMSGVDGKGNRKKKDEVDASKFNVEDTLSGILANRKKDDNTNKQEE